MMYIEKDSVSQKSGSIAGWLCLFFGSLGLHRFYVGKYKSGFVYLIFGSSLLGINISSKIGLLFGMLGGIKGVLIGIFLFALVAVAILYDFYALYNEAFLDKDGKILLSGARKDELVGRSFDEKFIDLIDIIVTCLLFIFYLISYVIIFYFVF